MPYSYVAHGHSYTMNRINRFIQIYSGVYEISLSIIAWVIIWWTDKTEKKMIHVMYLIFYHPNFNSFEINK